MPAGARAGTNTALQQRKLCWFILPSKGGEWHLWHFKGTHRVWHLLSAKELSLPQNLQQHQGVSFSRALPHLLCKEPGCILALRRHNFSWLSSFLGKVHLHQPQPCVVERGCCQAWRFCHLLSPSVAFCHQLLTRMQSTVRASAPVIVCLSHQHGL